jgi:hypothetical protein
MNFTFCGCSLTAGDGLSLEKNDPNNYSNLVSANYNANVKNIAKKGSSNYDIFIAGVNEILFNTPDILFLQWTGLNRHLMHPSLYIEFPIINQDSVTEIKHLDIQFSKKFLKKFVDQFLLLNHNYHNILALINYCKILEKISENKSKIVMINGLLPWTEELIRKDACDDPVNSFSLYTQRLLSVHNLPDEDIKLFFNKIHYGLEEIEKNNWVNMFNSLSKQKIDLGNDNRHPGPKSHQLYANTIITYLEKQQ